MAQKSFSFLRRFVAIYYSCFLFVAAVSIWFVMTYADQSWAVSAMALGLLTTFGLLGILLTILFTRWQTRPLTVVANYTAHILDGDYAKADDDELSHVMPGLGDLISDLANRFKERLGFSKSILEGLPVPICIVDTEQNITFLNRECLQMIGSNEDPESYYGRKISQIFTRMIASPRLRTVWMTIHAP